MQVAVAEEEADSAVVKNSVNSTSQRRFCCLKLKGLGLMRIIRGMQRSFCCEDLKKSFSKGIGITAPRARTRDKLFWFRVLDH